MGPDGALLDRRLQQKAPYMTRSKLVATFLVLALAVLIAAPSANAADQIPNEFVNCDPLEGALDAEHCEDVVSVGSFCMDWSDAPCADTVAWEYRYGTKITSGDTKRCQAFLNEKFTYPRFRTSEVAEEKLGDIAVSVTGAARMVRNPTVARIDIDNDGRPESILHFQTIGPSWRHCDSSALVHLNDDETDMLEEPLNNLLRPPVACPDSFRPFLYEGKTYIELRHQKPGRYRLNLLTQVLMIERGRLRTICRFSTS